MKSWHFAHHHRTGALQAQLYSFLTLALYGNDVPYFVVPQSIFTKKLCTNSTGSVDTSQRWLIQSYQEDCVRFKTWQLGLLYCCKQNNLAWNIRPQNGIRQEEGSFHQQTGSQFKEETNKVLHLEHSVLWCWKLDTLKRRSEIRGEFSNVVLEETEEDHLDRTCEKWRGIT